MQFFSTKLAVVNIVCFFILDMPSKQQCLCQLFSMPRMCHLLPHTALCKVKSTNWTPKTCIVYWGSKLPKCSTHLGYSITPPIVRENPVPIGYASPPPRYTADLSITALKRCLNVYDCNLMNCKLILTKWAIWDCIFDAKMQISLIDTYCPNHLRTTNQEVSWAKYWCWFVPEVLVTFVLSFFLFIFSSPAFEFGDPLFPCPCTLSHSVCLPLIHHFSLSLLHLKFGFMGFSFFHAFRFIWSNWNQNWHW